MVTNPSEYKVPAYQVSYLRLLIHCI